MTADKKKKKKTPEIKVVFDTDRLYTLSESELVRKDVHDLIVKNNHQDVKIGWYLPDVVRHERTFQMQKVARKLLPNLERVERLLGHNFGITAALLEKQVEEVVKAKEEELGLTRLELDHSRVDWNRLMLDAVYRRPPFEDNQKEKGFRDALIAESFLQLVEDSPKDPERCRVVMLTADGLLAQTVRSRTVGAKNVFDYPNVDKFQGVLNTLVSEVGESFIADIQPKVDAYFFIADDKNSLFYREQFEDRIRRDFADVLEKVPEGASSRETTHWAVFTPNFVKKSGQMVHWSTRVNVNARAYRSKQTPYDMQDWWTSRPSAQPETGIIVSTKGGSYGELGVKPHSQPKTDPLTTTAGSYAGLTTVSDLWGERENAYTRLIGSGRFEKVLSHEGVDIFEVIWKVQVTTAKNLRNPQIVDIKYVETEWTPV